MLTQDWIKLDLNVIASAGKMSTKDTYQRIIEKEERVNQRRRSAMFHGFVDKVMAVGIDRIDRPPSDQ